MKSLRTEKKEPLSSVLVSAARGAAAPAQGSQFLHVCRRWWRTARLWWRCPAERRRAWAYTAACAGLSLTNVALLLWISYVQNALQSALSEKQPGAWGWGPGTPAGCLGHRHPRPHSHIMLCAATSCNSPSLPPCQHVRLPQVCPAPRSATLCRSLASAHRP